MLGVFALRVSPATVRRTMESFELFEETAARNRFDADGEPQAFSTAQGRRVREALCSVDYDALQDVDGWIAEVIGVGEAGSVRRSSTTGPMSNSEYPVNSLTRVMSRRIEVRPGSPCPLLCFTCPAFLLVARRTVSLQKTMLSACIHRRRTIHTSTLQSSVPWTLMGYLRSLCARTVRITLNRAHVDSSSFCTGISSS